MAKPGRQTQWKVGFGAGKPTDTGGKKEEERKKKSAGEDVEKREPSHTVDGNVNWCNHYVEQYGGSLKKNRCRSTI